MEPLSSWGDELDMERVSDCSLNLDCRTGPWKEAWFGLRILKVLGGTGSFRASVRLVRKSKGGFRYLLRWEDEKTWSSLKLPHRKVRKVPGAWQRSSEPADHAETPLKAYEDLARRDWMKEKEEERR